MTPVMKSDDQLFTANHHGNITLFTTALVSGQVLLKKLFPHLTTHYRPLLHTASLDCRKLCACFVPAPTRYDIKTTVLPLHRYPLLLTSMYPSNTWVGWCCHCCVGTAPRHLLPCPLGSSTAMLALVPSLVYWCVYCGVYGVSSPAPSGRAGGRTVVPRPGSHGYSLAVVAALPSSPALPGSVCG